MSDVDQTLCLLLLIFCLGACPITAFWEIEAARQRSLSESSSSAMPRDPR